MIVETTFKIKKTKMCVSSTDKQQTTEKAKGKKIISFKLICSQAPKTLKPWPVHLHPQTYEKCVLYTSECRRTQTPILRPPTECLQEDLFT